MSTVMLSEIPITRVSVKPSEQQILDWCCELTLSPSPRNQTLQAISALDDEGRSEFLRLLNMNHVIIRALEPVARYAALNGNSSLIAWTGRTMNAEKARVINALGAITFDEEELLTARDHYEHALAIAREQGTRQIEGRALWSEAVLYGRSLRRRQC